MRLLRPNSAGVDHSNAEYRRFSLKFCRQASILARASSSDKNQCSFRHSWRGRPLKLSTATLSVGLPGLLKFSSTPRAYAHLSMALEMNSLPLSVLMVCGGPRCKTMLPRTRMTSPPFKLWPASIAQHQPVASALAVGAVGRSLITLARGDRYALMTGHTALSADRLRSLHSSP